MTKIPSNQDKLKESSQRLIEAYKQKHFETSSFRHVFVDFENG